jgi:hypothetical protein
MRIAKLLVEARSKMSKEIATEKLASGPPYSNTLAREGNVANRSPGQPNKRELRGGDRSGRARLVTLLFVTLTASLVCFAAPWISVVTLGRIRLAVTVTISIIAFVTAFTTTGLAVVVHGRRGLWMILATLPALFWPVFAASTLVACSIEDCD